MKLTLDEVRRLTGPNLLSNKPGAILDVFIEGVSSLTVVETWLEKLQCCFDALNWQENYYTRFYQGGASVSISAPMDLLYSACDVLELSWEMCVAELSNNTIDVQSRIAKLKQDIQIEANPDLIKFMQAATEHEVICLVDDDEISLGTGTTAETWALADMPSIQKLDWSKYSQIPLALITGTNGKSTSVRLAAEIAKAAGLQAGVTSTDFIKVGDTIIDEGDYSGPGGARMLLRDKRTNIAYLEVARGGLLRRGLPIEQANAALVTNVASDHLGQYGINTVDDIAHVKLMVAKAIKHANTLVLNADDARLVKYSKHLDIPICWFSLDECNPLIQEHMTHLKPCVFVKQNQLIYSDKKQTIVANVNEIPMTVNGSAAHNIQNALGVVGLSLAMGLKISAVKQGLMNFASNANDNPGRTNIYEKDGVTVIVDFAHNPHSMNAVMQMANKMPKQNMHVMFSHAGDRSNEDFTNVADAIFEMTPATYILAELEEYLRGREPNEISTIVNAHLLNKGIKAKQIVWADDPVDGAKKALAQAKRGDLVLLFTLAKREEVQNLLN